MRLMECVRLRVKDVDFERGEIVIRDGKGAKDRVTMLPDSVVEDLRIHLTQHRKLFEEDKRRGKATVYLPDALAREDFPSPRPFPRKRGEGVSEEWGWQYVFPSGSFSIDPRSGATIWMRN